MAEHRDDELAREIRTHLETEAEDRVADGLSEREARYAARRAFGNVTRAREDARAVWTRRWLDDLRGDFRYGLRSLARTPAFTVVAILTLALGIGANVAIFSVVSTVLLRPLPYPEADRLVRITEQSAPEDGQPAAPAQAMTMNEDEFLWWRSESRTLSHLAAYLNDTMTYSGPEGALTLAGARVSPAIFDMLGIAPALGRTLWADDERPDAGVVVLGDDTWRQRFGADPGVLGRSVVLDGRPYTVVGVMPEAFGFPGPQTEFWVPFVAQPFPTRMINFRVVARLAGGVSVEAATAEANALGTASRGPSRPGAPADRFGVVSVLDELVAPVRPALRVLVVAVGLVLLIACANVANLLLGRASARSAETRVRAALGAGRGRLVRQWLTESLLLAVLGGAAGIALAVGSVQILRQLGSTLDRPDLPGEGSAIIPRLHELAITPSTLAYAVAVCLATVVVFGLWPALRASGAGGPGRSSAGDPSGRGRAALVSVEVAMATVLLIGAGLLMSSFANLVSVPLGYDPSGTVTFQVPLPRERYPRGEDTGRFAQALAARLGAIDGVEAAGYMDTIPTSGAWSRVWNLRRSLVPREGIDLLARWVGHDYFRAMGTRIVEGRGYEGGDAAERPTLVINQSLARQVFPGERAVGQRVYFIDGVWRRSQDDPETLWEIVGVVEDVRQFGLDQTSDPAVYIDSRQVVRSNRDSETAGGWYYVVRTARVPSTLVPQIRAAIAGIDPQATASSIATMDEILSNAVVSPRFYATLLGVFASVAVLLSAVGIYGVVAYTVSRRTREIGIRIALGARRHAVLRLMLGQILLVVAAGLCIGLAGAALFARSLDTMLFGLTPVDPVTFVLAPVSFAVVAAVAAFIPSRRATRIDPQTALRCE